jgi:hypothetical protein
MWWTGASEGARAMASQPSSRQPRWPRLLIGAVLLWRALCLGAFADSGGVLDARFLSEWSSPGLSRSVKLTFTSYYWDADVSPAPRADEHTHPISAVGSTRADVMPSPVLRRPRQTSL